MTATDARLWHPWLRINPVLGVMQQDAARWAGDQRILALLPRPRLFCASGFWNAADYTDEPTGWPIEAETSGVFVPCLP